LSPATIQVQAQMQEQSMWLQCIQQQVLACKKGLLTIEGIIHGIIPCWLENSIQQWPL
jgi:hypothetical protein